MPRDKVADPLQAIADLQRTLDERTAERDEALAQQTATAEVLQVINSSSGDLGPVFEAILENAHALCGTEYGSLQLYEDEKFHAVAVRGLPQALADRLKEGYSPSHSLPNYKLLEGAPFVRIPDMAEIDDPMARDLFVALRKACSAMCAASRTCARGFAMTGMKTSSRCSG